MKGFFVFTPAGVSVVVKEGNEVKFQKDFESVSRALRFCDDEGIETCLVSEVTTLC